MFLRQMNYFVSVVRLNSFTEAAEENFISQSAISQQIKALEEELGTQLLLREGRRFSLTPAGEYFYRKCLLILDELEQASRETARISGGAIPELRVGLPKSYGGRELQTALAEFSGEHPSVVLRMVQGNHEELHDSLRFGGSDLVVNEQRRVFSQEYMNVHLAYRSCFIETAPHSALAALPYVEAEDLKNQPCILVSSLPQRDTEESYYRNYLGLSGDFLFAETLSEAKQLAAGNRGFLLLEGGSAAEAQPLRRIPLIRDGERINRNYCAFWSRENPNPYISDFAEALKAAFSRSEED